MSKYNVFKVNDKPVTYLGLYNHLLASVQTACKNCQCSKLSTDLLFSLYLTELSDYGTVYCLGNIYQICDKEI